MDLYVSAKFGLWAALNLISTLLIFSAISKLSSSPANVKAEKNRIKINTLIPYIVHLSQSRGFGVVLFIFGFGVIFIDGILLKLIIYFLALFSMIGIYLNVFADEKCDCFGGLADKRVTLIAQSVFLLCCFIVLVSNFVLGGIYSTFPAIINLGLVVGSVVFWLVIFFPILNAYTRNSNEIYKTSQLKMSEISKEEFIGYENHMPRNWSWAFEFEKPIFVVFSKSTCSACAQFLESFSDVLKNHSHQFTFLLISDSTVNYKSLDNVKILLDEQHLFLKSVSDELFPSALCINHQSGLPLAPVCQGVERIWLMFRLALSAL